MSSLLFQRRGDLRQSLRLRQYRHGLVGARQIIAVSEATRRDLQNTLGIRPDRIRMIYNAPDPIFTAPVRRMELDERSRIMERYQINYPYLLYAGNIRPQKNVPRVIEAFAVLKGELGSHPVVLGSATDHHRRRNLEVPCCAARRDSESSGAMRALSRVRSDPHAAYLLQICRGVRFSIAVRGLWAAAAGGDGVRDSGGNVERELAPRGGRRCGHHGRSGECV